MNRVELVGRLTRDVELRYSTGENANAYARFSIAVNRKYKNAEGNYDADFFNIAVFGKNAEYVEQNFHKGDGIGITGKLQTGSYINKDGVKVYTIDVIPDLDGIEFVERKKSGNNDVSNTQAKPANKNQQSNVSNDFINVPESSDDEVPWP